jgi:hypothetical protein
MDIGLAAQKYPMYEAPFLLPDGGLFWLAGSIPKVPFMNNYESAKT